LAQLLVWPLFHEYVPPPGNAVAQKLFVEPAHVSHPLPGLIELTPLTLHLAASNEPA
jgi:hypothetical protein